MSIEDDPTFQARALKLQADGTKAAVEWQQRMAAHPIQPVLTKTGRQFEDADPKRGCASPLGGAIW